MASDLLPTYKKKTVWKGYQVLLQQEHSRIHSIVSITGIKIGFITRTSLVQILVPDLILQMPVVPKVRDGAPNNGQQAIEKMYFIFNIFFNGSKL